MNKKSTLSLIALCGAAIATGIYGQSIESTLRGGLKVVASGKAQGKGITVVNNSVRPGADNRQNPGNTMNSRVAAAPNMSDSIVFYGLKYNDQGYNDLAGGPYNVIGWRGAENQKKFDVSPEIQTGRAAFYAKGKFYTFDSVDEKLRMTTYNAETWQVESQDQLCDAGTLRQVAAYNPVNGKGYVMGWGDLDWDTFKTMRPIYEVDLETKTAQEIGGRLEQLFIQTMFFDNAGTCYGIPYNEKCLYKISLEDASYEKVADLDLPFPRYPHSMSAITDPATDITYWAVPSNQTGDTFGFSYLYTIDRTNGHCELVGQLPNNEHVLGLYIKYAEPAAPAAASNFNLGKTFTFDVPATTYCSGEALSGALTAYLSIDGGAQQSYEVTAGQQASIALDMSEGFHQINVRIANAAGQGAERIYDAFVGSDAPSASTDVNLTIDNGVATLSWKPATESVHGGAYDDATVNYTITRYPEQEVVATGIKETTWSETLDDTRRYYSYQVTAYAGSIEGQSAMSNQEAYGSVWRAPHTETFDYESDFNVFTIYDGRGDDHNTADGCTWTWTEPLQSLYLRGCGSYNPEFGSYGGYGMDDWLITPALDLKAGQDYRMAYAFGAVSTNEHIQTYIARSTDVDGELTLISDFDMPWADESTWQRCDIFSVPEDGMYYYMIRVNTATVCMNFSLDDIKFDIYANFDAPAAVSALTAQAAQGTDLVNTISFTAPTLTYKGTALSEISRIDIFRNGAVKPAMSFEAPAPGAQLSWTDTECPNGMNDYRVVAFNAAGQGQEALISNWVGLDIPAMVKVSSCYLNDQYQPVFSWEPVGDRGIHGGYVDPADVTYKLCHYEAWNWDDHWPSLKDGITDCTTVDDVNYFYWQDLKNYLIKATNAAGTNDGTIINMVVGAPYEAPFAESFAWGFASNSPWTLVADSYEYAWNMTDGAGLAVKPFDGDNGMITWSYIQPESNTQVMQGPRVSLANLDKPELSFMMWHGFEADPTDVVVNVFANINDEGFKLLGSVDYNNGAEGWTRASFLLPAGVVAPEGHAATNVQIAFQAEALLPSASIFIDQVKIQNGIPCDLAALSISGKKRIEADQSSNLSVAVANYGIETAAGYQVVLHSTVNGEAADDVVLTTDGSELAPGQITILSATVMPGRSLAGQSVTYTAEIIAEGDAVVDNNVTPEFTLFLHGSSLPAATELAAVSAPEGVVLNWTAPATSEIVDPVTDTFEDYDSFIVEEIGDWKVYDGDGTPTVYFGGPEIPHCFEEKAWQIWTPGEAGFDVEKFDVLVAHSGSKYLASWCGSDGISSTLPTEDWLISSEIQGGTDVTFWVRVPNAGSDPQGIRMMYSTTDQDPESFTAFDSDEISGTTEWVELTYTLPADAKYFAVVANNNGGQCTVLLLDDIEYTPLYGATSQLTFVGYNVYRNDELIASQVAETTYTDTEAEAETYVYNVTAVWAEGESNYSNAATVTVIVGINELAAQPEDAVIYNTIGQRVNVAEQGIFVIRQGDKITKVQK